MNPNVESPMRILLATLSSHLEAQQPQAVYSLTPPLPATPLSATPPNIIELGISTSISSFPLEWKFVLKKCDNNEVNRQFQSLIAAPRWEVNTLPPSL